MTDAIAHPLTAAMADHQITIVATFVPWSRSRSYRAWIAGEDRRDPHGPKGPRSQAEIDRGPQVTDRNLNWTIDLLQAGRPIVTGIEYSDGIAHCPAYQNPDFGRPGFLSVNRDIALVYETEHGKRHRGHGPLPILPKPEDVLYALILDASVLDSPCFEDWAAEYGYDIDSRKAEAIYRAGLAIALKMRAGLGDATLAALRDAAQDY